LNALNSSARNCSDERPVRLTAFISAKSVLLIPAHPFYTRFNQILDRADFDGYVESFCQRFYTDEVGLPPGRYFRLLLIGCLPGRIRRSDPDHTQEHAQTGVRAARRAVADHNDRRSRNSLNTKRRGRSRANRHRGHRPCGPEDGVIGHASRQKACISLIATP
jgi:hypothetical protein